MNLLSSASIFSFFTLISRILGYLRDILIAIFLGASIFADAFFVAFRLPNTFRRLFAEGTFNAAFIPSYTAVKLKNKNTGKIFADNVLSFLFLVLIFRSIDTLKVFDIVWGTTAGGPGLATEALQTYAYRVAYSFLEKSKSMTVMVLFSIVVIFLTILYSRLNKDL